MSTVVKILEAALPKVRIHGWQEAMTLAIREEGLSDQAASIFPNHEFDLVQYWLDKQVNALSKVELDSNATPESRAKTLIEARLKANAALGPFLSPMVKMLAEPRHLRLSLDHLGRLSDEIWYLSGDRSSDSRWYTRRGGLGAVYAAAEAFQTQDTSKQFKDTMKLARKGINGLSSGESACDNVTEWVAFNVIASFNVLKSLTR